MLNRYIVSNCPRNPTYYIPVVLLIASANEMTVSIVVNGILLLRICYGNRIDVDLEKKSTSRDLTPSCSVVVLAHKRRNFKAGIKTPHTCDTLGGLEANDK